MTSHISYVIIHVIYDILCHVPYDEHNYVYIDVKQSVRTSRMYPSKLNCPEYCFKGSNMESPWTTLFLSMFLAIQPDGRTDKTCGQNNRLT